MAIKKIEFTKGEDLNIRSFPRIENKFVFENLAQLSENKDQLVVKCGKSFWDVTSAPEIFEAADDFDPNELTGIEKKEMQQPAAPVPAYENKPVALDPMSMLYQKTEEEEEEPEELVRKTYYLSPLIVEILDICRFKYKMEVSETVRELIMNGTPDEIKAEAEQNLALRKQTTGTSVVKRKKKKRIIH